MRMDASAPSGGSRMASSASASAGRRVRSGTCASPTTTLATSPSSVTSPIRSGCELTGVRRAVRAAALRARAGRCCRVWSAAGAAAGGCRSATAATRWCPTTRAFAATSCMAPSAASRSAGGGSNRSCSTPSSRCCDRLGSRRRSVRSSREAQSTRRGCAQPSWSSSARRSTPSAPDASSTRARRRTGSSRARWSANGSSG
jgi:hypothetical protein